MALVQWVNLEKEDIYARDSDIGNKERCGKLTVDVLFEKDKVPLNFKMKVTPVGNKNVTYTQGEQRRNSKFRLTQGAVGLADATHVLMEDTIQLPAAGGNKYKIEAQDANKVTVSSMEVEVKRKLYYQVLSMDDANGRVPAYTLAPMETHSLKHFIVLQKTGAARKIPYRKTITMHTGGNINSFGSDVGSAYNIDAKLKKVGIAAVFSDYISEMGEHIFSQVINIGTANPYVTVAAGDVTVVGDQFIWYGLDDADDAAKRWFIAGVLQHVDAAGAVSRYSIPAANVSITGAKRFTHGGYHKVKVTRDAGLNALLAKAAGVLTFAFKVYIPAGWTNGFSWSPGGADLITCAKRVVWEDMPANTKEYTWNHEVGHRFGMVAYGHRRGIRGYNKLPNGPATLYGENRGVNDKSHAGPHCEKGATYNAVTKVWSGVPGCVMFGANGIGSSHAPKEYCSDCEPIVRKLDLS